MRQPDLKRIFTSYAVAWLYLGGFIAAEVIYALLPPGPPDGLDRLGQHERA